MFNFIVPFLPLFFIFGLGYILRKTMFLTKDIADFFLKFAMYVALPCLILPKVATLPLSWTYAYLPFIAIMILLGNFFVFFVVTRFVHFPKKKQGVLLISCMIMNLSFVLPFYLVEVGEALFPIYVFFSLGHDALFAFVYFIASLHGTNKIHNPLLYGIKKILLLPPFWALVVGLLLNFTGIHVPSFLGSTMTMLGGLLVPLVLLALGAYFEFFIKNPLEIFPVIGARMLVGGLLALFFVKLFALDGASRLIVLLGGIAPLGFNTLVFASLEELDKEYAAQLVSVSLLLGLIVIPLALFFI